MLRRIYNFKDTLLLEWGDIIIEHLKTDIEQFADFDTKFNANFIVYLQQLVDKAYKEGGDFFNIVELKQKTISVENAMEACRPITEN